MNPQVVFDCMVFLQAATRHAGPARACLQLVDDDRVTLWVSHEILDEVRDVLTRPKLQRRFPMLTIDAVQEFCRNVEQKSVMPTVVPKLVTLERDPKDERYLNLAVAVRAEYLVTRDFDLLDLMNDEPFRQRFPFLTILDPVAFLRVMAQRQPAGDPS